MRKRLRITINAPFVLAFVGLCFAVTLLGSLTGGKSTRLLFMTYHSPLLSPLTWLRAFTHVLGHSGWAHLIGNMSYILLLGPMLEEKYGSKTLLTVTVVTALATSIFNYIVFPNIALCGASGVVFAFILMSSFTGFKEGEIPLTFILVALFYIGQQVYEGLTVNDNISNTSHIIGGIVGGFFGYILNVRSGRKRF